MKLREEKDKYKETFSLVGKNPYLAGTQSYVNSFRKAIDDNGQQKQKKVEEIILVAK